MFHLLLLITAFSALPVSADWGIDFWNSNTCSYRLAKFPNVPIAYFSYRLNRTYADGACYILGQDTPFPDCSFYDGVSLDAPTDCIRPQQKYRDLFLEPVSISYALTPGTRCKLGWVTGDFLALDTMMPKPAYCDRFEEIHGDQCIKGRDGYDRGLATIAFRCEEI